MIKTFGEQPKEFVSFIHGHFKDLRHVMRFCLPTRIFQSLEISDIKQEQSHMKHPHHQVNTVLSHHKQST